MQYYRVHRSGSMLGGGGGDGDGVCVYGSSLICSDCEPDAGVYCHCSLFSIYFVIFSVSSSFFFDVFFSYFYPKIHLFSCFENSKENVNECVTATTAANERYIFRIPYIFLRFFFHFTSSFLYTDRKINRCLSTSKKIHYM